MKGGKEVDTLEQYEEMVNSISLYSGLSITERMLSSGLLVIAQELRAMREDRQRQSQELIQAINAAAGYS